ncbi:MAG: hypothetical protein SWH78_00400 [Thermodesulfobacteriota bacterium]|nr:hypothetical protein [Thermodesulfobacteriota bacterium]
MDVRVAQRIKWWLVVVLAGSFLWGCGSGQRVSRRYTEQVRDIKTVLVLPFQAATEYYDAGATVQCFECEYFVQTGTIEAGADTFMNEELMAFLESDTPYKPIPFWTVQGVTSKMPSQDLRGADRSLLIQMGKSLQADAVIGGTLYRFRERAGTSLSVTTPASVAFAIELIRVSDGRTLWGRAFDETQRSLDENLLKLGSFLKRGGGWLTAEELAAAGFKEVMASFPVP